MSVPLAHVALAWDASAGVVAVAILAAALFVQAFARLRRRGRTDLAPWTRPLLFGLGLAAGVLPLVSPLDSAGDTYLLSAHMLQHVAIGDLSPLLIVLAVRGPLVFFLLPPAVLKSLASLRPLRALLRVLLKPPVTFTAWVAVMLGWHLPPAYDSALAHPLVHDAEHMCFVLVGTLAWTQLLDPARHGRLTRAGRIGFAFGLLVFGHPIVDVLLFSSSPVYHPYALQPHRMLGLGVLTDQRLAGTVMLAEQLLTLGVFVGVQLWPLLRRSATPRVAAQGQT